MPTMRTIVIGVPQRLTQDQGSAVSRYYGNRVSSEDDDVIGTYLPPRADRSVAETRIGSPQRPS
jgi:hypothetical protein